MNSDQEWGSRSKAIEFPFPLAVNAYLMRAHSVPRIVYKRDGVLYHYTDATGLLGIVTGHKLWATNTAFLNDPSERFHALDVARAALGKRIGSSDLQDRFIRGVCSKLSIGKDTELYTVSFCEDGDLLSQWRGYAAFGNGYAVGFSLPHLIPHIQVAWLIEIVYEDSKISEVVDDILSIFMEYINGNERHIEECEEWFVDTISFISEGFKHTGFREEKEFRLVFRRSANIIAATDEERWYGSPISYRVRGSDIVPYIATELYFPNSPNRPERMPISEIIVGPGVDFERNKTSIFGLLAKNGYPSCEIKRSRVPLR